MIDSIQSMLPRSGAALALSASALISSGQAQASDSLLERVQDGQDTTIVTLGTSLSLSNVGWMGPFQSWIQSQAPEPSDVTIHNLAVGGGHSGTGTKGAGLEKMSQALSYNPDAVFIEFATNDAYTPYGISQQDSIDNLENMIGQFKAQNPDVIIVVQTMNNPIGDELALRPDYAAYQQGYRDVAAQEGVLLVDNLVVWEDLYANDTTSWNGLMRDEVHPNSTGNSAVTVMNVQAALRSELSIEPIQTSTLDISASFNADVFATSSTDDAGLGFGEFGGDRSEDYKLRVNLPTSTAISASDRTFNAIDGGPQFELGAFDQNNAIMLTQNDSVTIDIEDQKISTLYALHTSVFLNQGTDGTFVFNYADGSSSDELTWDLRDWTGAQGDDAVAIAGTFGDINGTALLADAKMYVAEFANADSDKVVTSITFAVPAVGSDTDQDNAILAISTVPTVPVPEPGSLVLMSLASLSLLRRRRN